MTSGDGRAEGRARGARAEAVGAGEAGLGVVPASVAGAGVVRLIGRRAGGQETGGSSHQNRLTGPPARREPDGQVGSRPRGPSAGAWGGGHRSAGTTPAGVRKPLPAPQLVDRSRQFTLPLSMQPGSVGHDPAEGRVQVATLPERIQQAEPEAAVSVMDRHITGRRQPGRGGRIHPATLAMRLQVAELAGFRQRRPDEVGAHLAPHGERKRREWQQGNLRPVHHLLLLLDGAEDLAASILEGRGKGVVMAGAGRHDKESGLIELTQDGAVGEVIPAHDLDQSLRCSGLVRLLVNRGKQARGRELLADILAPHGLIRAIDIELAIAGLDGAKLELDGLGGGAGGRPGVGLRKLAAAEGAGRHKKADKRQQREAIQRGDTRLSIH